MNNEPKIYTNYNGLHRIQELAGLHSSLTKVRLLLDYTVCVRVCVCGRACVCLFTRKKVYSAQYLGITLCISRYYQIFLMLEHDAVRAYGMCVVLSLRKTTAFTHYDVKVQYHIIT